MSSPKEKAKEFESVAQKFLEPKEREELLGSIKKDKTDWFRWVSQIKGILKNIDKIEAAKFSALVLFVEQKPTNQFYQDNLKKFLIEKIEFYRNYNFSLDEKLAQEKRKRGDLWISKVLRLFISRSFLGMLILVLIVGFILWFYLDRESCLEFVDKVVGTFLKALK